MRVTSLLLPLAVFLFSSTTTAMPIPASWELDINNPVQLERSPNDPEFQELQRRIVFNPKILSPKAGDVWEAGSQRTVTWKTSDIPAELKNAKSQVKLGYLPASGAGGENLKWTLADKFALTAGKATFKLPADLSTRKDYIVVLFGDSGNASPRFTIKGKTGKRDEHEHAHPHPHAHPAPEKIEAPVAAAAPADALKVSTDTSYDVAGVKGTVQTSYEA